ncbi:polyphosphate kinase 2 family protein [Microbulbifer sp. OS29]|uniref:Polyphosphate kinase 2 family protein n=1 Tax=Microbulbifer okhotskensis TaxID=2926617 RepID=A0A9X2ELW6_9GAMM|nr:polyphosphate kinase 2 family protein [Microbulbifer okhotskensis]MCO1334639.1 polyphosphate kinase 2 family protein [Microbulbifer okhotskensis]
MMNCFENFRVKPGSKIQLSEIDPSFKHCYDNREEALPETNRMDEQIRTLTYKLYAEHKQSLLICLQGIDASGKDGTIKHVLGATNPQMCTALSFKEPTQEESEHDFLWRYHKVTPGQGHISIFNRSHYESVLIERVHNLVPEKVWSGRYDQINSFESLLTGSNTLVLKFFLYISQNEQLDRFKQRIDDPARQWKISESDYTEAKYWDDYIAAFENMLNRCSTQHAPWFIIPANHKWFRDLAVASIIAEALKSLNPQFPAPSVNIEEIKNKYHKLRES